MTHIPKRFTINTTSFKYYWEQGIGVSLLAQLGYQPDINKANAYIPYLFNGDALFDQLVKDFHLKIGFPNAQQAIKNYFHQIKDAHTSFLTEFFSQIDFAPSWFNKESMAHGILLSQRSGVPGLISLRDYCLMGGYESAAINKPLIGTGALKKGAAKRLTDTVTFWVDLTADPNLTANPQALYVIFETRCIHSYARVMLQEKTNWNTNDWGVPINQWDMLATNLGFSLVFMTGLKNMNFNISEAEQLGVMDLWRYVGYLLGIPETLLPTNITEAIEHLYYWTMTQSPGDQDSIQLALALHKEPLMVRNLKYQWQKELLYQLHLYFNYHLLGHYSCKLLQLPDYKAVANLGKVMLWFNKQANKNLTTEKYQRMVAKGRKAHEKTKADYQQYNNF